MNPFMKEAIALSRSFEQNPDNTPFGAVVVIDGEVVGRGTSSVVRLHDPTAHAEVIAIRDATSRRQNHLLPDAVLYCSGYPCPLCLMTCYWAQIPTVYYGARLEDSAAAGFEDEYFYEQLRRTPDQRDVSVLGAGAEAAEEAADALRQWKHRHDLAEDSDRTS